MLIKKISINITILKINFLMERNLQKKEVYEVPRYILFLALTLQFVVGGLRFSDGQFLRTISFGDDIMPQYFKIILYLNILGISFKNINIKNFINKFF